jgi:hypothetical protein
MWKSSSLTEWLQEHRIVQIDLHKIDRLDDKFKERSVRKYEIKTYEEIRRTWGSKLQWLQERKILQIDLHKIHRLGDKIKERMARKYEIETYEEIRRMWGSIFFTSGNSGR